MKAIKVLALLCFFFSTFPLWADPLPASQSAMQSMSMPTGAKATAMGGAFSAVADDPTANNWNPAGLAWFPNPEIQTTYNGWLMDSFYQNVGIVIPSEYGTFGFQGSYFDYGNFDLRTGSGTLIGSTAPNAFGGGLAYANKIGDFGFGLAGKYYRENIANYAYFAYGVDAGLMLGIENLKLAVGGRNIGAFSDFNLPENFYVGAGYHIGLGSTSFLFASEVSLSPNQNAIIHGGLEVGYLKTVFLRAGYQSTDYNLGNLGTSGLSGGVGLMYFPMSLDFSMTSYGDLGTSLKVSLGYQFGETKDKEQQSKENGKN